MNNLGSDIIFLKENPLNRLVEFDGFRKAAVGFWQRVLLIKNSCASGLDGSTKQNHKQFQIRLSLA